MNRFVKTTAAASLSMLLSSTAFANNEVEELKRRLDALEKRSELSASAEEKVGPELSFAGLVEVEGAFVDTEGAKSTSDITLATLELGLEAKLNSWITGYGVLLYEQGENNDNISVDQAYIRMKSGSSPLFLEVGRLTQSFGSFESGMVSDPMTLELGETTGHASVRAGYEEDGLAGSVSVFKGDVQKAGESEIQSLVAALGWSGEQDDFRYGFGASWTNNMADTDGLQDSFDADGKKTTADFVGGWSVNAMAGYGSFELRGEYLGACDSFKDGGDYSGRQPSAWSVEAGYRCELPLRLAVRYEGSDDFGTNDSRYGATVGWDVVDGAGLALEYQRADNKAGTADTDTLTMQLAMEF
ncbi:LbtU family siderophore porin [Chlorobium sp. N1]|uniref:LbtU family siderophore porin n=1 Tax=Chlorobium sp. N1 TaxID=2491138 RepID=UPI00103E18A4|nr:LbtU family siderophore porin [Chlorobium sp. N1]TCD47041.1 LbtU family siderophore porin [Chlorobium sp. N1]